MKSLELIHYKKSLRLVPCSIGLSICTIMLHPICDCLTDAVCGPNTVLETACQEDKKDTMKNSGGEKTGLCTTAVCCLWRYFNLPGVYWLYSSFQFTPDALRNRPTLQPFLAYSIEQTWLSLYFKWLWAFPRYFLSLEQAQASLLKDEKPVSHPNNSQPRKWPQPRPPEPATRDTNL